ASVQNLQTLLNGVKPGDRVFVLDPGSDGVQQMADIITANNLHDLTAIQIVSHGGVGTVHLGSIDLNDDNLASHTRALATIGASLQAGGDIMLYGCDVDAKGGG